MSWIPKAAKALAKARVFPNETHCFLVSACDLRRVVRELFEAFDGGDKTASSSSPPHPQFLHAFAAKANFQQSVLGILAKEGMGCETASMGEFTMAQRVFDPTKIVFDSPVKTMEELRHALYQPCYLNVDNFSELERVAAIHQEKPILAQVGIRVNPQLGAGSIGTLSTALATSKFGVGLQDSKQEILEAFKTYPFLSMLHVHTGSQGIGLTMMVEGVKAIVALAEEINHTMIGTVHNEKKKVVRTIDIGGGLSVNFATDEMIPSFAEYAAALREGVPSLFDGTYERVITEFGRAVIAKSGFLASRVEYCKVSGGRRIIQQHIGADLAIRTVWAPKVWPLRVSIFNGATGEELSEAVGTTDVAGPCCLGGDLVGVEKDLPLATPMRDIVVLKDTGGYFHASFSTYNLRRAPSVYIFDSEATTEGEQLRKIRDAQTLEESIALFGQ